MTSHVWGKWVVIDVGVILDTSASHSENFFFPPNMLAMRGSDLTMKVSGQMHRRGPPQVARVPQCARIAIRHPDPQKHKVF